MFDWVLNTPMLNVFKVNNKDTTTLSFVLVFGYLEDIQHYFQLVSLLNYSFSAQICAKFFGTESFHDNLQGNQKNLCEITLGADPRLLSKITI